MNDSTSTSEQTTQAVAPRMADVYHRGEWLREPDPVAWDDCGDPSHDPRPEAGFESYTFLGEEGGFTPHVQVSRRARVPRFLLEYVDIAAGHEVVYADDFVDAADLLAKWAPIVQAQAINWALHELVSPSARHSSEDTLARMASRITYGQANSRTWAARDTEDARLTHELNAERRRAKNDPTE